MTHTLDHRASQGSNFEAASAGGTRFPQPGTVGSFSVGTSPIDIRTPTTGGDINQQLLDYFASQGGGGGGFQLGFGDTEAGFNQLLQLSTNKLQEDIRFNTGQINNWKSQLESADDQFAKTLQFKIDQLEGTLDFQFTQLEQNQTQFDTSAQFQQDQLFQQGTQFDARLGFDVAGQAQQGAQFGQQLALQAKTQGDAHTIALGSLDLQGQQLAISARKLELDAMVAKGQLELGQAQLKLQEEISKGQLQLGRDTLAQNAEQFAQNFSLQQEIQRAQIETNNRLASVQEGQLSLNEKEQRERLQFDRSALISERFGLDPTRQAFAALGLAGEGLLTPEDVAFGRGAPGPLAGTAAGPVLVGEEGPELVESESTINVEPLTDETPLPPPERQAAHGGSFAANNQLHRQTGGTVSQRHAQQLRNRAASEAAFVGVGSSRTEVADVRFRGGTDPNATIQRDRAGRRIRPSFGTRRTVDLTTTTQPPAPTPAQITPQTQAQELTPAPAAAPPTSPPVDTGPTPEEIASQVENARLAAANVASGVGTALGLAPGTLALSREEGFTGLPSVQKAARAFQFAGNPVRTLLGSAFGLGNKITGGVNRDEFVRQIQDVTPRGSLTF